MWLRLLRRGGWQVLEKGAKAPKEVVWTYDVQARAAPCARAVSGLGCGRLDWLTLRPRRAVARLA